MMTFRHRLRADDTGVIRMSSGCHQDVIRMSSGCHQDVIRMSSGCHQDVIRMSSGCHHNKNEKYFKYINVLAKKK